MDFVADESVDFGIIRLLRAKGHLITSIAENSPGIKDDEVLNVANSEKAILLTEDKDFGELTFRLRKYHCGILLIRLADLPRNKRLSVASETIHRYSNQLAHCFSVLTSKGLRIKEL